MTSLLDLLGHANTQQTANTNMHGDQAVTVDWMQRFEQQLNQVQPVVRALVNSWHDRPAKREGGPVSQDRHMIRTQDSIRPRPLHNPAVLSPGGSANGRGGHQPPRQMSQGEEPHQSGMKNSRKSNMPTSPLAKLTKSTHATRAA